MGPEKRPLEIGITDHLERAVSVEVCMGLGQRDRKGTISDER